MTYFQKLAQNQFREISGRIGYKMHSQLNMQVWDKSRIKYGIKSGTKSGTKSGKKSNDIF